jgi:hypothetical protein
MPSSRNTDSPKEVTPQQLALAVETLSNIHYLIGQSCDDPDLVKRFVEMAEPATEKLRELARRCEPIEHAPSINAEPPLVSFPDAADRTDPLPLAAAGEKRPASIGDASPETRVDSSKSIDIASRR